MAAEHATLKKRLYRLETSISVLGSTSDPNSAAISEFSTCFERLERRDRKLIIFGLPNISSEDRINKYYLSC